MDSTDSLYSHKSLDSPQHTVVRKEQ